MFGCPGVRGPHYNGYANGYGKRLAWPVSVRHALLALLSEGPKYGLRLQQEFEERTGEVWPLNVGQVYITLQRLERDGLVESGDERQPGIVLCGLRLQAPVPLHQLDHVPPVDLHDVVHISPGHPQADQHLDDKLITRRRDIARRCAKPALQLRTAGLGDHKPLLRSRPTLVAGLHEPIALKALQSYIHLPHIQRPHFAGPLLELLLQTQAVLRPLAQQGQQRVPDAHRPSQTLCITISIIVMVTDCKRRELVVPGERRTVHARETS